MLMVAQGMTNFFRRIKPEAPVVRNNYFIQVDDKLAWSESIGEEDGEGVSWGTAVCFHPFQRIWDMC
jgi:alpha-1,2-mannosyltransferase